MRSRANKFKKSIKKSALKKANFQCEICSSSLMMKIAEPHHILPVSLGGLTVRENLTILCRRCHVNLHKNL